jgi:hypothetical protein
MYKKVAKGSKKTIAFANNIDRIFLIGKVFAAFTSNIYHTLSKGRLNAICHTPR